MLTPNQVLFFRNEAILLWEKFVNKFSSEYYAQITEIPRLGEFNPSIKPDTVFICFLLAKRVRTDEADSLRGRYFVVNKDRYYSAYLCSKKNIVLNTVNWSSQAQYENSEVPE